jgi:hypothetical protein
MCAGPGTTYGATSDAYASLLRPQGSSWGVLALVQSFPEHMRGRASAAAAAVPCMNCFVGGFVVCAPECT